MPGRSSIDSLGNGWILQREMQAVAFSLGESFRTLLGEALHALSSEPFDPPLSWPQGHAVVLFPADLVAEHQAIRVVDGPVWVQVGRVIQVPTVRSTSPRIARARASRL